jgi:hypothetical protein
MSQETPPVHRVERVDDIPVLLATSKVLKVDAIPDRHFPTGHRWLGALTFGEVACVWLAFITSQGDHRLNQVQLWVQDHLQWRVRKKLQAVQETLKGLYAGQPGRQTKSPSAELLLQAWKGVSLVIVHAADDVTAHLTPLTALQKELLELWELPESLYSRRALRFLEPPPS